MAIFVLFLCVVLKCPFFSISLKISSFVIFIVKFETRLQKQKKKIDMFVIDVKIAGIINRNGTICQWEREIFLPGMHWIVINILGDRFRIACMHLDAHCSPLSMNNKIQLVQIIWDHVWRPENTWYGEDVQKLRNRTKIFSFCRMNKRWMIWLFNENGVKSTALWRGRGDSSHSPAQIECVHWIR